MAFDRYFRLPSKNDQETRKASYHHKRHKYANANCRTVSFRLQNLSYLTHSKNSLINNFLPTRPNVSLYKKRLNSLTPPSVPVATDVQDRAPTINRKRDKRLNISPRPPPIPVPTEKDKVPDDWEPFPASLQISEAIK